MSLPYENSTSGERALGEIQKLLRGFGCAKFGSMSDDEAHEIMVQFEYRGRQVSVKASIQGYAAAWLKAHPYSTRSRSSRTDYERKAMDVASVAVYAPDNHPHQRGEASALGTPAGSAEPGGGGVGGFDPH